MRELKQEHFDNKIEQSKISDAILSAIPEGVQYYNLLMVLNDLQGRMMQHAFGNKVYKHRPESAKAKTP